ncbi:hypothetical protein [Nocardia australiensis]|uniref:hypothetical protein n=1 Tax=Nocardia australiensis TaxID=2887191 RepID=UPI001D144590|nr:hypothetical protein [Nocardia australiensis]
MRTTIATALLAIAATGIMSGTAGAAPTPTVPETVQGNTAGVGYTVARDGAKVITTLTGGTFRTAEDGVDVLDQGGRIVAHLPMRVAVENYDLALTPHVEGAKLIADAHAEEIGSWRLTSPWQRSIEAGIGIGGLTGALAGAFVGMVIGILAGGILVPITLPIGLIVGLLGGMAVGGAAGASIPNSQTPDQWDYQQECDGSGEYRFCW